MHCARRHIGPKSRKHVQCGERGRTPSPKPTPASRVSTHAHRLFEMFGAEAANYPPPSMQQTESRAAELPCHAGQGIFGQEEFGEPILKIGSSPDFRDGVRVRDGAPGAMEGPRRTKPSIAPKKPLKPLKKPLPHFK
eukprot:GHVU01232059.1.p1 GENE.GHVU01232059.1~~GHVU01232059.1.p1  ORF type:complete len:137 (-),score=7.83 GHVU01232059.1:132-542(-)